MYNRLSNSVNMNLLKLRSLNFNRKYALKKCKTKKDILKIYLTLPFRIVKVLIGKELNIPYVEIVLTTFCNLKCNGCSALMPYYKKSKNYSLDRNIESIKRLVNASDSINHLRLLGGEVLCYPYLYDFLVYLKKQDKIKRIALVTNGTMTLKDKKIIEILKDDKFYFSISYYKDASLNYDKLIEQLKENNIKYIPMREDYEWIDYGGFNKRGRSVKELNKQYLNCTHRVRSLLDGKLFQCFRCSHATNLKLIKLRDKDYIDLFDKKITTKQLKRKLYKFIYKHTDYIESCDYCDCLTTNKLIPRGEQSVKKK